MYSDNANRQPTQTTSRSNKPQLTQPPVYISHPAQPFCTYSTRPLRATHNPTQHLKKRTPPKKNPKNRRYPTQGRQPPKRHPARRRPILGKAGHPAWPQQQAACRLFLLLLFSLSIPCTCPVPIYDLQGAARRNGRWPAKQILMVGGTVRMNEYWMDGCRYRSLIKFLV